MNEKNGSPDEHTGAPDPRSLPVNEETDTFDRVVDAGRMSAEKVLPIPSDEDPNLAAPDEPEEETDRADVISEGLRNFSSWCLRFLIVAAALTVFGVAMSYLWGGVLPILLALIVSTVLWPLAFALRKLRLPSALAALLAILITLGLFVGIFALMAPAIRNQLPALVTQFNQGLAHLQRMLMEPPFNIQNDQLTDALQEATTWLQQRAGEIASGVVSGITTVTSITITLLVTLVLTFFFIKDGDRFLPWVRMVSGKRVGWHLTEVLTRSWNTLSGFIRTQAIVSFIDALFIGLGLWILNVPMALVLAVITFFAGFIPIIGAVTAGFIAVVIALVANGLTNAIMVLVLILLVQQLEGNILSPMLQSKAMDLHAAIVLLAVTVGAGLFSIIGAFLAVPVAAVLAVWFRYLGDMIDLRTGEKTATDIQFATEAGSQSGFRVENLTKLRKQQETTTADLDGDNADSTAAPAEQLQAPMDTATNVINRISDVVRKPFRKD